MTSIRDLARAKLAQLDAGHRPGQSPGQQVSHPPSIGPAPWDSSNPPKSVENGRVSHCPTPIGTGRRDTRAETGTRVGTVGGTAGTISEGLAKARLREWHAHLVQIEDCRAPEGFALGWWQQTCDDARWIYENFASRAVRDGWSAHDLFGVLPWHPGWGGLCDRLAGARNLKMDQNRAAWSRFGVRDWTCRGAGDGLVSSGLLLIWKL